MLLVRFVILVACFVVANTAVLAEYHNDVVEFKVAKQDKLLHDVLQRSEKIKDGPRLRNIVFKNCGNPAKDLANVNNLHLGPDPIVFPGDISVSFNISIKKKIDAPLQGKVLIEKKDGDSWIKLPCIGELIGSCDYPDVCDLLKNVVCPPQFDDHKVPCKCPFGQGKYVLPSSTFTVGVPVFPAGDYHFNGNLTYNLVPVACVDLHVTFG